MEIDAIRIKTLQSGKRKGKLISTEFENLTNPIELEVLVYKLNSKEVDLCDIDSLTDGEYSITLFEPVSVAAPIVAEGAETPKYTLKDTYRYIGDEEPL